MTVPPTADGDAERALVARMVALAEELIASFDPLLRRRVWLRPFASEDTETERRRWFYTPTDHGGVELSAMTPRQQSLTMQLLATGLTREAYVAVCVVLGLENVLDELEGWGVDWGRERGRDPNLYWLRIFGRPGDRFWGWRFGGHHVSVNLLLHDGRVVAATPCFIGADPASSPMLTGTLRPLGGSEDLARELMQSLTSDQRDQTLLHPRAVSDIVSGNRPRVTDGDQMMHMQVLFRGSLEEPRLRRLVDRIDEVAERQSGYDANDHARMALDSSAGLRAVDMSPGQRELLVALVDDYLARAPAPVAECRRREYREPSQLDELRLGWAGSVAVGEPHYFRVAGPRLLIEYDNTQRGANHAHSVVRDPDGDFGLNVLARHRARHHDASSRCV